MRLSTIPGADERDAILLDLEDGDLYLTARVDGAHTSVQMDARAVDRLIRDLQHWRYVNESAPAIRYHAPRWQDRATPHFSIDEDGKVTQLLPLQRRVDDMARNLLQVELGYGWPIHATEERAHHSYVPPNNHARVFRTVVPPEPELDMAAIREAIRRALELDGNTSVEWQDPTPMTSQLRREAARRIFALIEPEPIPTFTDDPYPEGPLPPLEGWEELGYISDDGLG